MRPNNTATALRKIAGAVSLSLPFISSAIVSVTKAIWLSFFQSNVKLASPLNDFVSPVPNMPQDLAHSFTAADFRWISIFGTEFVSSEDCPSSNCSLRTCRTSRSNCPSSVTKSVPLKLPFGKQSWPARKGPTILVSGKSTFALADAGPICVINGNVAQTAASSPSSFGKSPSIAFAVKGLRERPIHRKSS